MKFKLLQLVKTVSKVAIYGILVQCVTYSMLLATEMKAQKSQSIKEVFIDLNIDNSAISLVDIFESIESKTDYRFAYDKRDINKKIKVLLEKEPQTVADVLLKVSEVSGLKFKQINKIINIDKIKRSERGEKILQIVVDDIDLSGKITDENGQGLPGASLFIKGSSKGTTTDINGNYKLAVPENSILVISFIGYVTEEVLVEKQNVMDLQMKVDASQLEEVVVTAFGVERSKKALGYAVQQVNGDDINTVKASTSAISNLKGRVAGVNITESGSGPGAGVRVIIRGNNSLTQNNQPLFIVDGIPMDNTSLNQGGSVYNSGNSGSGISDINADDIESMSVLKGPNAAALYGSRAANGVIMITTKKGTAGRGLNVGYSTSAVFSSPLMLPEYQNEYGQGSQGQISTDYDELRSRGGSWGGKLDGSNQLYWDGTSKPYTAQPDNVKNFFETGSNVVNTLVLSAGNEAVTTRFSYSNTNNQAMVPNSYLKRNNFNLRTTAKLSERLSIDTKATYISQFTKNRINQGTEGLLTGVFGIPRNAIVSDFEDFQDESTGLVRNVTDNGVNPYWLLNHDKSEETRNRLMGFAKATYKFNDWLSAFGRIGTDWTEIRGEGITNTGHWFVRDGSIGFSENSIQETNADFLFMVDKNLTEKIHLNVNLGGNHLKQRHASISTNGTDFRIPAVTTLGSAAVVTGSSGIPSERETNSLYGSAQLSYGGYVFLDVTGRNDWSSTLPAANRSFFYPSASLSVILSEFIDPDQVVMDMLKIRGSWAEVGKDAPARRLENGYNLKGSTNSYLGITTLTVPGTWNDVNIRPEFTKTFELGLEAVLFSNRLSLDFAYYDIKTTDLIDVVSTDNQQVNPNNYGQVHTNVGQISNKGFEIMLGGTPLRTADLSWDIAFNLSKNTNKLDEFLPDVDSRGWNSTNGGAIDTRATVGGEYGEIWGTRILRDDNGRMIVTAAGIPRATSEREKLGSFQPDFLSGLSNNLTYKNFSLRMLIDGRFGGQMYLGTEAAMDGAGVSPQSLQYREGGITVDGLIDNGDDTFSENTNLITAQQYWGAMSGIGENYITDQTNVRMRELSITYNVPSSVLGNTFVKSASIGFIGRNLFFLHKGFDGNFDPEATLGTSNAGQGIMLYGMPTARSFGFNLNVKF